MKRITALLFFAGVFVYSYAVAQNKTLTFIGDSRAFMLGASEACVMSQYEDDWKAYLNCDKKVIRDAREGGNIVYTKDNINNGPRILNENEFPYVINLGKGGLKASEVYYFYSQNENFLISTAASDIIHISIGGNDVLNYLTILKELIDAKNWEGVLIWDWARGLMADTTAKCTEYFIQALLGINTKGKIILNDVAPIMLVPSISDDLLQRLNARYQEIPGRLGNRVLYLKTFDVFKPNRDSEGLLTANTYYFEGIHYSLLGNQVWGKLIARMIRSIFPVEPVISAPCDCRPCVPNSCLPAGHCVKACP
jgi:lysophospholipase L1-like esterase